MLQHNAIL